MYAIPAFIGSDPAAARARRTPRAVLAGALIAVALLGAACSGHSPPAPTPAASTGPAAAATGTPVQATSTAAATTPADRFGALSVADPIALPPHLALVVEVYRPYTDGGRIASSASSPPPTAASSISRLSAARAACRPHRR